MTNQHLRRRGHYQLEQTALSGSIRRALTGLVALSDAKESWVTVTRTGRFTDPRYGTFEITPTMLASMVKNFDAGVAGIDIFVDVSHKPELGAAAKVLALKVEGARLRARVEWTDYGRSAVQERGFRYLSAEYDEQYIDNEQGANHGAVLLGAGLTVRPVIKRLDPITLADDPTQQVPVLVHPDLLKTLADESQQLMNKHLELLRKRLAAAGLDAANIERICTAYSTSAKHLAEDATEHTALVDQFVGIGEQVRAAPAGATVQLAVTTGIDADAVRKLLAETATENERVRKLASDNLEARRTQYTTALAAAEGLSESTRVTLAEASELIGADATEEQVKALAAQQIKLGNQLEVARQLSAIGYTPAGAVRVTMSENNTILKLSQDIRTHLRLTGTHAVGEIRAPTDESKLSPLARKALAEFDRRNAHQLAGEAKMLAGGPVVISDTSLPASYQREVLVESLADLRILDLVSADVEPTDSATHTIPYEERVTNTVYGDGITYEGQAIPLAGVRQANTYAYIEPMKIALEQSDEVMHFTRANGLINWDAWARNIASNSRLARELIARRISNRMQRSADAYGAVAVSAEAVDSQVTVSNSLIKLANWPLVRPYQARDLQGTAIGSPEHPITVVRNGTTITEYNGTGTQAAGTYWTVESYNLGFIRYVTELGVPVMAADSGTNTISYSYATNVAKFDLDNGSTELPKHLNGLIRTIGTRKALMHTDRFVMPDFGLSSSILNDTASNAEQFIVTLKREGTNVNATGDLVEIKGVPQWATNTVSDLGDERILLGVRGTLRYRIAKPFQIGERYPVLNASGRPLGKWGAYGTEFSSMCVPEPLRRNFSSVIAYSGAARTAAA